MLRRSIWLEELMNGLLDGMAGMKASFWGLFKLNSFSKFNLLYKYNYTAATKAAVFPCQETTSTAITVM